MLHHNRTAWVAEAVRNLSLRHTVNCLLLDAASPETALERWVRNADLVIIDVSKRDTHTDDALRTIWRLRAQQGQRPALVCITEIDHGIRFQLELERMGARVIDES